MARTLTGASVTCVSIRLLLHRGGIGLLCAVSVAVGIALAWWQWERFSAANGSFQNLGYVLQWPLFGLFPLFAMWRIRVLRAKKVELAVVAKQLEPPPLAPQQSSVEQAATDEDAELAAYNRYLAELNARAH